MPDASDFKSLFERVSDPAIVVDGGGVVAAANDAFAALVARPAASLAGEAAAVLFAFDEDERAAGEDERVAGGEVRAGGDASVFVGEGRGSLRVWVERLPCLWEGREAQVWLARRADGAWRGGQGDDRLRALLGYLQEATDQIEVVNRVVAAVNSGHTIEEVFSLASRQIAALVPFDRASITLCEEGCDFLRVFAISGEGVGSLAVGATGRFKGSVTELALAERCTVVIPDLHAETRFNVYKDLEREGFRSSVCVPLFSTRRAVGSLNLTSRRPAAYERRHLLALERLAPPLSIAIEKVLLLEEAERRSRVLEAAARREELAGRIGRQLASSLDPSHVLQETVETLGQALQSERCFIALFGEDEGAASVGYEYLARPDVASLSYALGGSQMLRASRHAARVLAAGEAVQVADLSEMGGDEDLRDLYRRLEVRSVLSAPVRVGGSLGGLLEVHDDYRPRTWTEEECKLLCTVAGQVSVALTNAQLYDAARLRNEELYGLFEISRLFSTLSDTSEISSRLASAIAKLVGGEMCLIATYDRRRNAVRAEGPGHNTPPELIREFHFTLDREQAGAPVYQTGEAFVSNDPANDPRFNRAFIERHRIRSALSVPMRIKRELIGFIYVGNRPGGFRERDLHLLEIFAAQAAETIVNARLFLTIQAQAEREAVVNRLLLSLQRSGEPKDKVRAVIERVGEVLDVDRCVAVLFAEGEHEDYYGEWCAEGVEPVTGQRDVRERSPIRYALRVARRPLLSSDVLQHPLAPGFEDLIERAGLKSLMVAPIMHQGRVIGSISAHQTRLRREWSEDDLDLLVAVATHVGATLENARLISELREANRLKDEFLATLSHELRTPLTAITGWVEFLNEVKAPEMDKDIADGLAAISTSATSLTQLISDLLDLSRIQRGVLRLERHLCDLNHVAQSAARTVRQAATARRLDLQLELSEGLPLTVADAHRMQQVLWNLLTNALKFTPAGGQVRLRTRLEDQRLIPGDGGGEGKLSPQHLVIEVTDTGEGIPADFMPFIWDRFRQADGSATRRHGGLGIGLSLVKELVEAHGGQVDAESQGRGATFIVRLPVIEAEHWVEREPHFETPPQSQTGGLKADG